jgi:aerobic carbon-monoxide dehydrogenase medium subunit
VTTAADERPASVQEALDRLDEQGPAHVLAGGTALTLLRRQGFIEPGPVVDLGGIEGLDGIRPTADGGLEIGAMATLRSIETSPLVRRRAPALAEVIARVATVRIRNQATIGGNLAHADPAQDPPPILIALDAEVEIAAPGGARRTSLDGFFVDVFETVLGPAEILTAIFVPPLAPGSRIGYEKFLPRTADDYATVSVAARLDVAADGTTADARIVLGAVAAIPLRVPAAEAALRGAPVDQLPLDAAIDAVLAAVDPMDDARGSADYKRAMAGVWTRRLLGRLARPPADGSPA